MKDANNSFDSVSFPKHYCSGSVELVDVWRASMSHEELCGFFRGNILKYIFRCERKNGVEDLKKARVYLEWLIKEKEEKEEKKKENEK